MTAWKTMISIENPRTEKLIFLGWKPVTTWMPIPCPAEGCGYVAQFKIDKTPNADPFQLKNTQDALVAEHRSEEGHPGGPDEDYTTDPALED